MVSRDGIDPLDWPFRGYYFNLLLFVFLFLQTYRRQVSSLVAIMALGLAKPAFHRRVVCFATTHTGFRFQSKGLFSLLPSRVDLKDWCGSFS